MRCLSTTPLPLSPQSIPTLALLQHAAAFNKLKQDTTLLVYAGGARNSHPVTLVDQKAAFQKLSMNVVGKHRSAQPTHQTKLPGSSGNSSSSNIRPFSHDLSDNVLSTMQVKAAAAIGKQATQVYSISFQTTSTGMSCFIMTGFRLISSRVVEQLSRLDDPTSLCPSAYLVIMIVQASLAGQEMKRGEAPPPPPWRHSVAIYICICLIQQSAVMGKSN